MLASALVNHLTEQHYQWQHPLPWYNYPMQYIIGFVVHNCILTQSSFYPCEGIVISQTLLSPAPHPRTCADLYVHGRGLGTRLFQFQGHWKHKKVVRTSPKKWRGHGCTGRTTSDSLESRSQLGKFGDRVTGPRDHPWFRGPGCHHSGLGCSFWTRCDGKEALTEEGMIIVKKTHITVNGITSQIECPKDKLTAGYL